MSDEVTSRGKAGVISMCRLNLSIPTETLLSEQALTDRLTRDEPAVPAATADPCFLYRGQPNRYLRSWPPRDEPGINITADTYRDFDSIIPNDYRDLEAGLRAIANHAKPSQTLQNILNRYGDPVAHMRYVLARKAVWERAKASTSAVSRWVNRAGSTPRAKHQMLSIGQHYGFKTQYLDASSAWPVAIVFATRHWSGLAKGTYMDPGEAVLYRIDYAVLETVRDAFNTAGQHGRMEIVDIRSTPALLAPRASGQQGWSLIGFESPFFLSELIKAGGIQTFRFQRTGPSTQNTHALFQQMQPASDPFLIHSELYRTPGTWIDDVQKQFDGSFHPIDLHDHSWLAEIYAS